jgi:protein-disulfide isomerase
LAHRNKAKVQESAPKSPFVIVLIIAAIVGVGAIAYAVSSRVAQADMAVAPVEVAGLDNPQTLMQLAQGVTVLGNADAPVTIMEFADFSCPACKQFKDVVMPRINLNYAQTGVARVVFHDLVLGSFPHSFLAARAARCANDQQRYVEYYDLLFANQATWSTRSSAPAGLFEDYAQQIGLDEDAFEACLRSDRYADVVTANRRMADELNMSSTPSIAVYGPGQRLPALAENDFESVARAVETARQGG